MSNPSDNPDRPDVAGPSHFGFTKLQVLDLEAAATFYKRVFGLIEQARISEIMLGEEMQEILFNATSPGGATFILIRFLKRSLPSEGEVILGFETTDLPALLARAHTFGGQVREAITERPQYGIRFAVIADPEGHLIEVLERLPS